MHGFPSLMTRPDSNREVAAAVSVQAIHGGPKFPPRFRYVVRAHPFRRVALAPAIPLIATGRDPVDEGRTSIVQNVIDGNAFFSS